jgi:hypothetical protein
MSCVLCGSGNQAEFPAEVMVHFTGRRHLDQPGVLLFPKLLVCLDCGSSRFAVPEKKLALLLSNAQKNEQCTQIAGS